MAQWIKWQTALAVTQIAGQSAGYSALPDGSLQLGAPG